MNGVGIIRHNKLAAWSGGKTLDSSIRLPEAIFSRFPVRSSSKFRVCRYEGVYTGVLYLGLSRGAIIRMRRSRAWPNRSLSSVSSTASPCSFFRSSSGRFRHFFPFFRLLLVLRRRFFRYTIIYFRDKRRLRKTRGIATANLSF